MHFRVYLGREEGFKGEAGEQNKSGQEVNPRRDNGHGMIVILRCTPPYLSPFFFWIPKGFLNSWQMK